MFLCPKTVWRRYSSPVTFCINTILRRLKLHSLSARSAIFQESKHGCFCGGSDQIRVRLRSKGPIVNEVAKKYNGGGHPLAAGASIYDWKDTDLVIADLERICKENK